MAKNGICYLTKLKHTHCIIQLHFKQIYQENYLFLLTMLFTQKIKVCLNDLFHEKKIALIIFKIHKKHQIKHKKTSIKNSVSIFPIMIIFIISPLGVFNNVIVTTLKSYHFLFVKPQFLLLTRINCEISFFINYLQNFVG